MKRRVLKKANKINEDKKQIFENNPIDAIKYYSDLIKRLGKYNVRK